MHLLTAAQTKEWDAATLRAQGISSNQLMERAARACMQWLQSRFDKTTPFLVLCGCGNNGGDGLALTRFLMQEGYAAKAFILKHQPTLTPDTQVQEQQLPVSALQVLQPGNLITDLPAAIVLVDAILGAGSSRSLDGWLKDFIAALNKLPHQKISIDLPTGLQADVLPVQDDVVLQATDTLCLQQFKRTLLHPEGGRFAGRLHRIAIGLGEQFMRRTATPWHTIEDGLIQSLFRQRTPFSHKGTLGTALIIGGSYGMMGAAALAARAAGRGGAGKVRALVPKAGYEILQTLAPEALCQISGDQYLTSMHDFAGAANGIAVGMGMGSHAQTAAALKELLEQYHKPLVLDADAINILANHQDWLKELTPLSILTPHPKEFERLFGPTPHSMARLELARKKAKEFQIILVMKDRYSTIVTPTGEVWYNLRGSSAMATGGSGDVLSGILAGLLAQGYSPFAAAVLGVHLHAVAGEYAAKAMGIHATVAGDIAAHLGDAFKELEQ